MVSAGFYLWISSWEQLRKEDENVFWGLGGLIGALDSGLDFGKRQKEFDPNSKAAIGRPKMKMKILKILKSRRL